MGHVIPDLPGVQSWSRVPQQLLKDELKSGSAWLRGKSPELGIQTRDSGSNRRIAVVKFIPP